MANTGGDTRQYYYEYYGHTKRLIQIGVFWNSPVKLFVITAAHVLGAQWGVAREAEVIVTTHTEPARAMARGPAQVAGVAVLVRALAVPNDVITGSCGYYKKLS